MTDQEQLSEQFERHRLYLRAVAYRMLGSTSEAEDAVQESWLRLSRSDADSVANLRAWLTTVVGRVCVDMLRVRRWRREEYLGGAPSEPVVQVVADDDLRRVRRASPEQDADPALQRRIVDAFLAASRAGDLEALVAVLDPDIVFRVDLGPQASRRPPVRGADAVAPRSLRGVAPLRHWAGRRSSTARPGFSSCRTAGRSPRSPSPFRTSASSRSTWSPTPRSYAALMARCVTSVGLWCSAA
jgi:RNA polymerase sigma factor (sigma-70 family)